MRFVAFALALPLLGACASYTDDPNALSHRPTSHEGPAETIAATIENPDGTTEATTFSLSDFEDVPALSSSQRAAILAKYAGVKHTGVRADLFENAILFYDTNRAHIPNPDSLTVIDFKLHSKEKRFFILDMKQGAAPDAHVAAHGAGSDPNDDGYATAFSNLDGSHQSSIGYYLTGEVFDGVHGESLRLDGLSTTNSMARSRGIIVHSAAYVEEGRSKQGLSWGCPAVPEDVRHQIIERLRDGSLMFASN